MSIETLKVRNGAMIAIGAAALILAGCAGNGAKSTGGESNVACNGVNSCKGTSECKTAENACKGQNVCKGHGFITLTKQECDGKGGTHS